MDHSYSGWLLRRKRRGIWVFYPSYIFEGLLRTGLSNEVVVEIWYLSRSVEPHLIGAIILQREVSDIVNQITLNAGDIYTRSGHLLFCMYLEDRLALYANLRFSHHVIYGLFNIIISYAFSRVSLHFVASSYLITSHLVSSHLSCSRGIQLLRALSPPSILAPT